MHCTNIASVPPPTPGLPLMSAGTDGGVGRFRQINIDASGKKKNVAIYCNCTFPIKKRLRLLLSLSVARY